MHATDLDIDITCPACGGSGDPLPNDTRTACPFCEGSGTYNRLQDQPGDAVHIGPANYQEERGLIRVERLGQQPIEDDVTGGFDGRYGTFQSGNPNPDYEQDMLDRMANDFGVNAPYQLPDEDPYNGVQYGPTDLTTGPPTDADLSPDEVVAFLRARNDTFTADTLEATFQEVGLL